ncbi:MAG TPA: globin domain-containing protein [Vicinamibacterales bacterium]|jgi:hemoglobin-like flavoprotein|nr:globin domain-containing protein [Vicinamibacterales bacterium]
MTPDQRRLVKQTYEPVREMAGPLALLFYGRLFELDPSTRRLFHNDLALQGRKLMDTLDLLVASLDDFESVRARLATLGRRHRGYGVQPDQYPAVVTAFLWALGQALGPDFDAPTRDAWRAVLTAVSSAMQEAAAEA